MGKMSQKLLSNPLFFVYIYLQINVRLGRGGGGLDLLNYNNKKCVKSVPTGLLNHTFLYIPTPQLKMTFPIGICVFLGCPYILIPCILDYEKRN